MNDRAIYVVVAWMSVGFFAARAVEADRLRNVEPGHTMPAFALDTLDGRAIGSDVLRDKVTVVLFVAATQRSSEQAATAAHNVVRALRQRDVGMIFVTADVTQGAYFRQFRDKVNVHAPLALDIDRALYGQLGLIVLPTSLVVDRQSRLAFILSGYKSDYAHVLDGYVRRTLNLIDDDELQRHLTARTFRRDRPSDRAARHCAAA